MAIVLFYCNVLAFDIWNWTRQEIAALSLKIFKILKSHYFDKDHLVAAIHRHKWNGKPLPFAHTKNLFQA